MGFVLKDFAVSHGVADPERFIECCGRFFELLSAANARMNLTRITGRADFELKHVADSLAVTEFFPELADRELRVADIGCGAGFPSVILAAAFPKLRISAIDSTGKKVGFVSDAARELGLTNLSAIQGRAVELARQPRYRECFEVITARAVATAEKIFHECRTMPVRGGRFILYKTPGQAGELSAVSGERGWRWETTPGFELPEGAGTRLFMVGIRG